MEQKAERSIAAFFKKRNKYLVVAFFLHAVNRVSHIKILFVEADFEN